MLALILGSQELSYPCLAQLLVSWRTGELFLSVSFHLDIYSCSKPSSYSKNIGSFPDIFFTFPLVYFPNFSLVCFPKGNRHHYMEEFFFPVCLQLL